MRKYKQMSLVFGAVLTAFLAVITTKSALDIRDNVKYPLLDNLKMIEQEEPIPQYRYTRYNERIAYYDNLYKPTHLVRETITNVEMELTSLGYYYITAYAPEECGYNGYNYPTGWMTASGIICHRADYENRLTEPTTCAVDRSLHHIGSGGDLFYLPDFDRVFVAEDTGGAVVGKHLDLFYDDYWEMASFPSGWYETFSVEYIYTDEEVEYYDFDKTQGIRRIIYLNKKYGG